MREVAFILFLTALFGLGFKRPFLFVLAYAYIDIVSPQRLSYFLLNSLPISMIAVAFALISWLAVDDKKNARFAPRQGLLLLLLIYCGMTMNLSAFPLDAAEKWNWVWKALAFAIFLPLTLHTRLRIEALVLYMILCASSIIIVGGLKTVTSGGGYGVLNLMVSNNSGLYESSTIAMVAIAIIPLILWLMQHGTIFPPDRRVRLFGSALIFACLMIPIGTEARTGLICIALLGLLLLRFNRRRFLYIGLAAVLGLAAIPLLPASFTQRMDTIQGYQGDSSANTRLAVWGWTWDFAREHPFGGGFEAYRANKLRVESRQADGTGSEVHFDEARAFHSAYFEMLGEQGYPGLLLWLTIHLTGLFRMEVIRRRYRSNTRPDDQWVAPLAVALQNAHAIYLVGALFVGIAFQPFIFMLIGVQIGLDTYLARREKEAKAAPVRRLPKAAPA